MPEYTAEQVAEIMGITHLAVKNKAKRIRARGKPCGVLRNGPGMGKGLWIYTEADLKLLRIDWREKAARKDR